MWFVIQIKKFKFIRKFGTLHLFKQHMSTIPREPIVVGSIPEAGPSLINHIPSILEDPPIVGFGPSSSHDEVFGEIFPNDFVPRQEEEEILIPEKETIPLTKWTRSHPPNQVIGNPSSGVQTRSATNNECQFASFLSSLEPRTITEALKDADWVEVMQDELAEFERNVVWTLVPIAPNTSIVGSRWVYRNKFDDIRNKARHVVKGYSTTGRHRLR